MNKIWANQLIAGTTTWAEMPAARRPEVTKILLERLKKGEINAEKYEAITGEATSVEEDTNNE